eukprot:Hpha_TRINITY_DN16332_c2_g5::TRINITY_DN16332_c2_g5_i1::g.60885::m.60885/K07359/CAMKK2; calcium/calmodulin-dependent protein kinase kinase 2
MVGPPPPALLSPDCEKRPIFAPHPPPGAPPKNGDGRRPSIQTGCLSPVPMLKALLLVASDQHKGVRAAAASATGNVVRRVSIINTPMLSRLPADTLPALKKAVNLLLEHEVEGTQSVSEELNETTPGTDVHKAWRAMLDAGFTVVPSLISIAAGLAQVPESSLEVSRKATVPSFAVSDQRANVTLLVRKTDENHLGVEFDVVRERVIIKEIDPHGALAEAIEAHEGQNARLQAYNGATVLVGRDGADDDDLSQVWLVLDAWDEAEAGEEIVYIIDFSNPDKHKFKRKLANSMATGRRTPPTSPGPGREKSGSVSPGAANHRIDRSGSVISTSSRVIETDRVEKTEDEEGNKMINEYCVMSELGRGSYGKVKLVVHNATERLYAIKIMNKSVLAKVNKGGQGDLQGKSALDDAMHEIAVMKRLDHPNVVHLHEVINDPECNKMYLILEYIENGPVFRIGRDTPLALETVKHYTVGIAQGLDYMHQQGVAHRDIKPENILVGNAENPWRRPKLTDFGVSNDITRDEEEDDSGGEDTSPAGTVGTPAFFAPEHVLQQTISGFMADIWAVGVTLYVLAFADLPFRASNYPELSAKIAHAEVAYEGGPEGAEGDALKALLRHMLTKDMSERMGLQDGVREVLASRFCAGHPGVETVSYAAIPISAEERENAVVTGNNISLKFSTAVGAMMKIQAGVKGFKSLLGRSNFGALVKPLEGVGGAVVREKPEEVAEVAASDKGSECPMAMSWCDDAANSQEDEHSVTSPVLVKKRRRSLPTEHEQLAEDGEEALQDLLRVTQEGDVPELTLNCFQFQQLPGVIQEFVWLTSLTVHKNGLEELPAWIAELKLLTSLTLTENELTELPPEVGQLALLEKLDCTHNKLRSVPDTVGNLQKLRIARLDYNDLSELPACLSRVRGLQEFSCIRNCKVTRVPAVYNGCWDQCLIRLDNTPGMKALWESESPYTGLTLQWHKMYPDMVLPWLYLGSIRSTQTKEVYEELGITHLLTCGKGLRVIDPIPTGVTQRLLNVDDDPGQPLRPLFHEITDYLNDLRETNKIVLVHCFAGLSRSVTLVCAFLMKEHKMTFKEAIVTIRKARPPANPNVGFRKELVAYEEDLHGTRLPPDDIDHQPNFEYLESLNTLEVPSPKAADGRRIKRDFPEFGENGDAAGENTPKTEPG